MSYELCKSFRGFSNTLAGIHYIVIDFASFFFQPLYFLPSPTQKKKKSPYVFLLCSRYTNNFQRIPVFDPVLVFLAFFIQVITSFLVNAFVFFPAKIFFTSTAASLNAKVPLKSKSWVSCRSPSPQSHYVAGGREDMAIDWLLFWLASHCVPQYWTGSDWLHVLFTRGFPRAER